MLMGLVGLVGIRLLGAIWAFLSRDAVKDSWEQVWMPVFRLLGIGVQITFVITMLGAFHVPGFSFRDGLACMIPIASVYLGLASLLMLCWWAFMPASKDTRVDDVFWDTKSTPYWFWGSEAKRRRSAHAKKLVDQERSEAYRREKKRQEAASRLEQEILDLQVYIDRVTSVKSVADGSWVLLSNDRFNLIETRLKQIQSIVNKIKDRIAPDAAVEALSWEVIHDMAMRDIRMQGTNEREAWRSKKVASGYVADEYEGL